MGTALAPDCLSDSTCSYDDLVVECGASTRRKRETNETANRYKRQESDVVAVKFSLTITGIVTTFDQFLMYETALIEMSNNMENAVSAGDLDLNDRSVVPGSYQRDQYSDIKCDGSGEVREALQCSKKPNHIRLFKVNVKNAPCIIFHSQCFWMRYILKCLYIFKSLNS